MQIIINIQKEVEDKDKGQDFFNEIKEKLGVIPDAKIKAVVITNDKLD